MFLRNYVLPKPREFYVKSEKLWVVSCELWIVSCELWVVNCELWVVNCELWVVSGNGLLLRPCEFRPTFQTSMDAFTQVKTCERTSLSELKLNGCRAKTCWRTSLSELKLNSLTIKHNRTTLLNETEPTVWHLSWVIAWWSDRSFLRAIFHRAEKYSDNRCCNDCNYSGSISKNHS